jgi:hypothetical protein
MEVVVDGKTGLMMPDEGTTLQAIFHTLRASSRRTIVSFTLDGILLSPERQSALGPDQPGKYALLEVRTVDPFDYSLRTLTGLLNHLKNIERSHEETIACAAAGEYARTLDKAEICFYGWDILLRAVRDVGTLSAADFKGLDAAGATVAVRIRDLQDALLLLASALEAKEMPRISEMIRGGFQSRLGEWRSVLEALARHVACLPGSADKTNIE